MYLHGTGPHGKLPPRPRSGCAGRRAAIPVAARVCEKRLPEGVFRARAPPVRVFVPVPSAAARTLRTHVLIAADITPCPADARCARSGPLVPHARGRLRRRLGGRQGRANCADPPAPSAAAQGFRAAPPWGGRPSPAGVHLTDFQRQARRRPHGRGAMERTGQARGRSLVAPWLPGRAHGDARGPGQPRPASLRRTVQRRLRWSRD